MTAPISAEFLALQELLAGRYSIERELGRGGMGIVLLARDVALDRPVAIKLLPPHLAARPDERERFLQEARTAAGLSHPNIVPIHLVEARGDLVFFVMGFVDGETLRDRVERAGPLPPRLATKLLQEVAWALGAAHQRGVIHRDVKPDNIMIERATERAVVTDFGIALGRRAGAADNAAGSVTGTARYMSPEQACGEPVDARSDLYSLGATFFYALTGRAPFEASNAPAILTKHVYEIAPLVETLRPEVPGKLGGVVDRLLRKAPAERFQTADDLARVGDGDGVVVERAAHRLDAAQGGHLAGGVAVEGEDDAPGEALEQADLRLGQRGAHRGDDVGVADLVGHDRVHVALDDHRDVGLADGVFGEVEAVEVGALVEDRGLRGVEVFGLGVAEGAPAEADDLAVAAADREEQAAAEAVVVAAPLALGRQAGLGELLRGVAARGEVGEEGVPGLGMLAYFPAPVSPTFTLIGSRPSCVTGRWSS